MPVTKVITQYLHYQKLANIMYLHHKYILQHVNVYILSHTQFETNTFGYWYFE